MFERVFDNLFLQGRLTMVSEVVLVQCESYKTIGSANGVDSSDSNDLEDDIDNVHQRSNLKRIKFKFEQK